MLQDVGGDSLGLRSFGNAILARFSAYTSIACSELQCEEKRVCRWWAVNLVQGPGLVSKGQFLKNSLGRGKSWIYALSRVEPTYHIPLDAPESTSNGEMSLLAWKQSCRSLTS
jgi:hypothetical protein